MSFINLLDIDTSDAQSVAVSEIVHSDSIIHNAYLSTNYDLARHSPALEQYISNIKGITEAARAVQRILETQGFKEEVELQKQVVDQITERLKWMEKLEGLLKRYRRSKVPIVNRKCTKSHLEPEEKSMKQSIGGLKEKLERVGKSGWCSWGEQRSGNT